MERQKLDISRQVTPTKRSGPMASESDKMLKLPDLIRNPGNIPFGWEKTPGRQKHDTKSLNHNSERNANESLEAVRSPNIPTTDARNLYSERINLSYVKPEKIWSCAERYAEKESFSSEDDEETHVVEQDTFSRSDSSLDNLSVSDFSSGTNEGLTGTVVSADSHTRDFIMGRFLSAAKAMASEMPPHSSKNKPVVSSNYTQTVVQEEEDSGEEDMNDEEDQINISVKGCRLLPSSCFLSPVPEMRMSPQKMVQLVGKVRANCFRTGHGTKWGRTEISSAASDKRTKIHEDRSRPSVESAFVRNEYFRRNNHKQSRNFATGPETFNNFRGFLRHQNKVHESQPESHVVEKTLYIIDSGHRTDQTPRTLPAREDRKIFTKNYGRFRDKTDISANVPSNDSLLQKLKYLSIADENKGLKTEIMPIPQSPLPPLFLNSPSDSWLHRALPSNFSRNQSHRSFHVKQQDPRQKIRVDPKWETMVKNSNPHRGHLRYTQMLTPIPELEAVNISV